MNPILARRSSRATLGAPGRTLAGPVALSCLVARPAALVFRSGRAALAALPVLAAVAALAAAPASASGQLVADYVPAPARDQDFDLSIRGIMRGEENVGQAPTAIRWTDDGRWVYFQWQPGGQAWDAGRSLYRVPAGGGEPERVDEVEARRLAPLLAGGDLSPDRRRRVAEVDGDLYLIDRASMDIRRLTRTDQDESDPLFSSDGASVLFRRGPNLHRLGLERGELAQLTRIEGPATDEDDEDEPQRAFLERQQLELFEHIRRDSIAEARADSIRALVRADEPDTVRLERNEEVDELVPTRDGAWILVRTETGAEDERQTMVPDWVTDDGYTAALTVRTKVGDEPDRARIGVLETATGSVRWLSVTPEDYEGEGPPRVSNMGWNDAGTKAFLFVASFDAKDRFLWSWDAETGETTLLDHLHDDAWVAGPCFSSCVGFLPGTDRIYFVSEASGYAHLYAVNADGSDKRPLTEGPWEVLDVEIPEDRAAFFLRTNEGSPFDEHLYRMGFDGSDREPLTRGEGRWVGTLSPDGERIAVLHDVANRPPELFLADADDVPEMTRVTESPTEAWASFPWIRPEIVRFPAEDRTMVPARIYRPSDLGATPNGAAVIFVHGAGYLHNVHNYWSSYAREYQFHHFLAANGYTVLDIDYRGSAGYGAAWRTGIYRWMGGKDLSDHVDGARWLVEQEGVDAARIGLYGGSYGGFITLMALFTAEDTFKSGAALRSVTDWAHYNHGYTNRILNQPQDDEEAYERSSPIYFAENLRPDQHLLMLHGMVDTNVHFSDIVRLSQRLIELGKENWELAVYPIENHGFVEPASWTDEYRRIFELFERTLREPACTAEGGFCAVRGAAGR